MTTNDMPEQIAWHEVTSTVTRYDRANDEYEWAETSDPRVLALMERQWDAQVSEVFDGDAIPPIFYRDYRHGLHWVAGYDGADEVSAAWERAYNHGAPPRRGWGPTSEDFADRFLRVFYGTYTRHVTGGYDRNGEWLIIDSPAFREHVGGDQTIEEDDLDGMEEELQHVLDSEVWGVGYAVKKERTTTESEVDLLDDTWDLELECWGYVGEKYARTEAFAYAMEAIDNLEPLMPGTEVN